jgi:hypothetical protein
VLSNDVGGDGRRRGLRAEGLLCDEPNGRECETESEYREHNRVNTSHVPSLPPRCGWESAPHTTGAIIFHFEQGCKQQEIEGKRKALPPNPGEASRIMIFSGS